MTELLPCPFCGGEPDMHSNSDGTTIHCTNDQCISHPLPFNDWGHESDAVAAWNTRASQAEIELLRKALQTIASRADGYSHGDDHVTAAFAGIVNIARDALSGSRD